MCSHLYRGQQFWLSCLGCSADNRGSRCSCKIQPSLCSWHLDHRWDHHWHIHQYLPNINDIIETINLSAISTTVCKFMCVLLRSQTSSCITNTFLSYVKCWLEMNAITNADVGLSWFLVWMSWFESHLTDTAKSSRLVSADRVRATYSGVQTLINIWQWKVNSENMLKMQKFTIKCWYSHKYSVDLTQMKRMSEIMIKVAINLVNFFFF